MKIIFNCFLVILIFSFRLHISPSLAQETDEVKQVKVSLRMIGHLILLASNDSISKVEPIEKNLNQYRIKFEKKFNFKPDELARIVDSLLDMAFFFKSYIVEVEHCRTKEIVYSYQRGVASLSDIVPCGSRNQPIDCYEIVITQLDVEKTISHVDAPAEPRLEKKGGNSSSLIVISLFIVILLLLITLIFKGKLIKKDSNNLKMGEFVFNTKDMTLSRKDQKVELSNKESELLLLLFLAENKTLEREHLLKLVWGDDGDYIGRTLDVFISKLRKKIEGDPKLKIVNVRGVGYKFIIS